MEKYARIINYDTLCDICKNKDKIAGIIIGHENCPHFYKQSEVDKMIELAITSNLAVKVNIPVLFEEYLEEFKIEAKRLIDSFPNIKLIVNDWGILSYLHNIYPEKKFVAGKGIAFTYGDNPWNEHILMEEREKYREVLKAHNMENPDTINELKNLGVDEIELSDLSMSKNAYKHLHDEGFIVSINKNMSVVTMSRACHCLRFLDKLNEMGECIQYCNKNLTLSIQKYYDMINTELKELSTETKNMQPDMIVNGNITMVKNSEVIKDYQNIDILIFDERVCNIFNER